MKKAKVLIATLLASGLVLSGCTFQEGLEMAKEWASSNVGQPVVNFWNEKILGKKPQEEQPKDKEEKQDEEDKPTPVAQLTSISISGQYKAEYEVGEEFDATGIVVTAVYDDGSTQDVTSQATFSGFSSEQAGPCTVSVSFEGQTATFDVTINPAVKRDWTAEEKAIFADHLHGEILPFFPVEGATPSYDAAEGNVRILDAEGNPLQVSGTQIPDYAAEFKAADGWVDVSNQYTAFSSAPTGSFWVFEKSVDTSEGLRRLSIQFFGYSGNSYSLEGSFGFYASDPFNYEFPAAAIAQAFADLGLEAFTFPAPDGDGLYFEYNPDPEENLYWLDLGYTSYVYDHLYIYGLSEEGYAAYIAKFEAQGWASSVSSGAYTLTKEFENGVGKLLSADAGDYAIVRIYYVMDPLPTTEWPTEGAAALVEAVVPGSQTVIPEFTSQDITNIEVDDSYNEIDVYGPESLKAEYAALLKEEGWTDGSAADYYVSPSGDVQIRLVFSTTYGLRIIISAVPVWPAAAVAAVIENLVPGSETVVPALDGGTKYDWWTATELDVYGSGQTLGATFEAALLAAGWTDLGSHLFLSPAQDITIEVAAYSSYVEIYFSVYVAPSAEWPTEAIAALLGDEVEQDTLPEFEGEASGYQTYTDYGMGLTIYVEAGTEEACMESYAATLLTAGFTAVEGEENTYLSPNGEFTAELWKGTNNSWNIELTVIPKPGYISRAITKFLEHRGLTNFETPDFASLEQYVYNFKVLMDGDDEYYPMVQIMFDGDLQTEVFAILTAANYEVPDTAGSYGYECFSADGAVEIDVKYYDSYGFTVVTVYSYADF
ncbi:MAG: bacterial Ig-like domain-containing protein [Bacilli bacterium]|nr:bacterial Ig-like domain-containing protein [Bacilli bacterium]